MPVKEKRLEVLNVMVRFLYKDCLENKWKSLEHESDRACNNSEHSNRCIQIPIQETIANAN